MHTHRYLSLKPVAQSLQQQYTSLIASPNNDSSLMVTDLLKAKALEHWSAVE
jgi:hypothetical protein